MALGVIASSINIVGRMAREPLFYWFLAYVATGLLWALVFQGGAAIDDRAWRLRILIFIIFFSAYILMSLANHKIVAAIIFTCAVLASVNNWVDFLVPFSFVPMGEEWSNPGRGAGLYVNANISGYAVISLVVASFPFMRKNSRVLSIIVMLLGVFPTFSRSAWIWSVLVTFFLIAYGYFKKSQITLIVLFFLLLTAGGVAVLRVVNDFDHINISNIQERVGFFIEMGEAQDDSAKERGAVAIKAWDVFAESPLVGSGLGAAADLVNNRSTHNMYLLLLAEQGLVGGFLYFVFLSFIFYSGFQSWRYGQSATQKDIGSALILFGGFFSFVGLFSHNLLEEPHAIFLLSFLLAAKQSFPFAKSKHAISYG